MQLPVATNPSSTESLHLPAPDALVVAGNHLTLFVESAPLIASMVKDISAATMRVWLEVYIFMDDAAGQAISEALRQRATAGVDVRVLYDAVGSQTTPASFFEQLTQAGVRVHAYHTLWESLKSGNPLQVFDRRNHRKLLVIDDQIGYFGGMNIVDTAANAARVAAGEKNVASAGWRDVHVRLRGPQQNELAESFSRSWARAHNEKIKRLPRLVRRATLPPQEDSIRFFDSGPGLKYSRAARVYRALIRRAQHDITLSMAYFIPVGQVLRALLRARRRKVRVRVIIPGQSDVKLVQYATEYLYNKLIKRGFAIYLRSNQMLHSKVMVADDQWTIVGSANMDPRSLAINLEFLAVIHSPAFAEAVLEICRYEEQHSIGVTREMCENVTWMQRLRRTLAWSIRWWL
jgi:cardiolipin synthase